jgi:hypothetical protein
LVTVCFYLSKNDFARVINNAAAPNIVATIQIISSFISVFILLSLSAKPVFTLA